jgi:hypothetical protein
MRKMRKMQQHISLLSDPLSVQYLLHWIPSELVVWWILLSVLVFGSSSSAVVSAIPPIPNDVQI